MGQERVEETRKKFLEGFTKRFFQWEAENRNW